MTRHITQMTLEDAPHYTPEQRAAIVASYPEHERDARTKGIPILGSGRVFPVAEEKIRCEPIAIPKHWARINGLDFGWDHPFAAAGLAHDRDADICYITGAYRERQAIPAVHVAAIRPWGAWIPCAWPHDGHQHDKGSGDQLAAQYRADGLNTLDEHATHEEGGYGIEAGISEMLERMQTDRFKVFSHLNEWYEEFRLYHRDKGLVVKEHDDLMSATRIAVMMLREAKTQPHKVKLAYDNRGFA